MPQPAENLTYESVVDAANPAYPWTPPMANAAVPVGAGVLAYQPRLYPASGADVAYPVVIDPSQPYPTGGGGLTSVALNAAGSWPGRIDFKVTTGPGAVAIAAYLGAPGVTLDKAAMPRYRCTVPPSATDAVVTVGDATRVNLALQPVQLGRQWSKAGAQYIHANSNLDNRCMVSDDGINWSSKTTPTDASVQLWNGVDYSPDLGRLCAIAAGGGTPNTSRAMTSDDGGETWTVRTLPLSFSGRAVVWGGPEGDRKFVAVSAAAATNNVLTSSDGITWQTRTKPSSGALRGVCWSPERALFVAVGDTAGTNTHVSTSPDGITWTSRNSPDVGWWSVCWSPELQRFVAISPTGAGRAMTSPDGITWTAKADALFDQFAWRSVCWSPEQMRFVTVADNGSGASRLAWSADGMIWNYADPGATGTHLCVTWAPALGLFVVVLTSGSMRVLTSPDGQVWTPRPNMPAANTWFAVCWAGAPFNRLVAVAQANGINPEKVWWKGMRAKAGEVWRLGVNVEAVAGSGVGFALGNPGYAAQTPITVSGLARIKATPAADADWLGVQAATDASCTVSDVVAFRETPACLLQGLYDVHVCHVDAKGVEGAVTKFSNVNVV